MRPLDFRLATFADLQARLQGQRVVVLAAWEKYGPGTTAEVAELAGLSILSFRPRTTELFQLGFICLDEEQEAEGEGVYRAREYFELVGWFDARSNTARDPQLALPLK
jgi:hypothetical protein